MTTVAQQQGADHPLPRLPPKAEPQADDYSTRTFGTWAYPHVPEHNACRAPLFPHPSSTTLLPHAHLHLCLQQPA